MSNAQPTKKIRRPAGSRKDIIRRAVTDFLNFDNMATQFAGQANEVKLMLRDQVLPKQGDSDDKGNSWFMFEDDPITDPSGKGLVIGIKRERRAPKTLNVEKAEAFLRKRKLWNACTETVTQVVINEDAILAKAFDKTITEEELNELYDIKETFAFVPQRRK